MSLELMPYQQKGVAFLTAHPHKLLADDMGLGKTPQAVAALSRHLDDLENFRVLIICPSSVKYNWAREILAWSGTTPNEIFIAEGSRTIINRAVKYIIINYDLLRYDKVFKQLQRLKYNALVCDEAHYLKTYDSKRTVAVLGNDPKLGKGLVHNAHYKYFLTGTPMLNRPIELWPLLYTCAPEVIRPHCEYEDFATYFCDAYIDEYGNFNDKGASNTDELRKRLESSNFYLRRTKDEVLKELPDVVEQNIYVDIDPNWLDIDLNEAEELGYDDPVEFLEATGYLATVRRKIAEAKLPALLAEIKERMNVINKLIVFTYHKDVSEKLTDKLSYLDPAIVYGGMTAQAKQMQVDKFVNNPNCRLFIGQVKAAGQGIDGLQKVCNYAMFGELDWSPGVMDQARDRLRRFGQKDAVFVYYLIARDTIEERIADTVRHKRGVIDSIINKKGKPMSIEKSLEAIANNEALERIADSLDAIKEFLVGLVGKDASALAEKPAKKKSKAKEEKPAEPEAKPNPEVVEPTEDDVLNAANDVINATADDTGNKAKARAIIQKYGTKISTVPVEKRADLIAELNAKADELANSPVEEL